jgi:hypothetical protein
MSTPAASGTPVPRSGLLLEVMRSGLLVLFLLVAAVLLLASHAWLLAGFFALLLIAAVVGGIVARPAQIDVARRPPEVHQVSVSPWERHRHVWVALTPDGSRGLCAPLRSRSDARRLAPGPLPAQVAGAMHAGAWVVVQVGQVTLWPAGPVREGLPPGAVPVQPRGAPRPPGERRSGWI